MGDGPALAVAELAVAPQQGGGRVAGLRRTQHSGASSSFVRPAAPSSVRQSATTRADVCPSPSSSILVGVVVVHGVAWTRREASANSKASADVSTSSSTAASPPPPAAHPRRLQPPHSPHSASPRHPQGASPHPFPTAATALFRLAPLLALASLRAHYMPWTMPPPMRMDDAGDGRTPARRWRTDNSATDGRD
uniref:Uncharacterized protein K0031E03.29 n=1 Tax=Oryza sativa subsp. indica TaxID=39946 RepID=C8TEX4_ORYSI|nr:hypothetical protein [Oryza sativa Indica Group]